jgi:hypothetical protein
MKNLNRNAAHVECKNKVTPVTVGAAGTVSDSSRQRQSNMPGKHEMKELQKTAIFGTAHVLRKALMQKYEILNMGSNVTRTINCNYRIVATLYTQETWFASGI